MKTTLIPIIALFALVLAGCADNTLSHDDGEPAYDVVLRFSDDHLTTLEDVEIEAFVTNERGEPVTSLETLTVEHRLEGESAWKTIEMAVHGDHYAADYRFMVSGEREFRVMGAIDEHDHLDVMYVMDGHMEIARAHMEMDGMRVSYEHFPGDIHEGDEAAIGFWIERMGDDDGHDAGHDDGHAADMMGGLSASIVCTESDGTTETHTADEHETGVYEAHHTFGEAGDAVMTIRFEQGGVTREASFTIPVKHPH